MQLQSFIRPNMTKRETYMLQFKPTVADLAMLQLILTGSSVVDMAESYFETRSDVDAFLRLHEFDTDNPMDMSRLREIAFEAITYLTEEHKYRFPQSLEQSNDIHDLFLQAAQGHKRHQQLACLILKVMHIQHHIQGHELLFNTPISEAQLFERVNTKVFSVIDQMRAQGITVAEFAAGQKSRTSLVTKLLAKRSTLAAQIFDKVRFRIVLGSKKEVVLALMYLTRHLFPFNYVIPGQSHNNLIGLADVLSVLPEHLSLHHFKPRDLFSDDQANEFSGSSYRSINFVVDIPLRIDDLAPDMSPAIAFIQAELQLMDEETAKSNEEGENAHHLYKKRQKDRVRERLERAFTPDIKHD